MCNARKSAHDSHLFAVKTAPTNQFADSMVTLIVIESTHEANIYRETVTVRAYTHSMSVTQNDWHHMR